MKIFSFILVLFVVALTSKPLVNNVLQFHKISITDTEQSCCSDCSGDCCNNNSEDTCNDSDHECSSDCTCIPNGVVVFTQSVSPEIQLFETILEKIESAYTSYQFTLNRPIWHPPELV